MDFLAIVKAAKMVYGDSGKIRAEKINCADDGGTKTVKFSITLETPGRKSGPESMH